MAITSTVTARISGNPREAIAWALDLANYLKENFNDSTRVLTRIGGPMGLIVWVSVTENLAAFEEQQQKLQADSGYQERIDQAVEKGLFDPATIETAIWTDLG